MKFIIKSPITPNNFKQGLPDFEVYFLQWQLKLRNLTLFFKLSILFDVSLFRYSFNKKRSTTVSLHSTFGSNSAFKHFFFLFWLKRTRVCKHRKKDFPWQRKNESLSSDKRQIAPSNAGENQVKALTSNMVKIWTR